MQARSGDFRPLPRTKLRQGRARAESAECTEGGAGHQNRTRPGEGRRGKVTPALGKMALTRSLNIELRKPADPVPDEVQGKPSARTTKSSAISKVGQDVVVDITLVNKANYTINLPPSYLTVATPAGTELMRLKCKGYDAPAGIFHSDLYEIAPGKRINVSCIFFNMRTSSDEADYWPLDEAGMKLLNQLGVPGKWSIDPGLQHFTVLSTAASEQLAN